MAAEQAKAPHRLIDICDPAEAYSVADFCRDVRLEIEQIVAQGRIPLLVGGTMMYFKTLLDGLSPMPASDGRIREQIEQEASTLALVMRSESYSSATIYIRICRLFARWVIDKCGRT